MTDESTDPEERVEKRGRRTAREEFISRLESGDVPREVIAELVDRVDFGPIPKKPDGPAPSLSDLGAHLRSEIGRRLQDPVEAAKVPATALWKMVEFVRDAPDDPDDPDPVAAEDEPSIAEVIAGIEGLPVARKREILERERKLLLGEVAEIDAQLEAAA